MTNYLSSNDVPRLRAGIFSQGETMSPELKNKLSEAFKPFFDAFKERNNEIEKQAVRLSSCLVQLINGERSRLGKSMGLSDIDLITFETAIILAITKAVLKDQIRRLKMPEINILSTYCESLCEAMEEK